MRLPGGKKGAHPARRQIATIVWGTLGTLPAPAGDIAKTTAQHTYTHKKI